jgi:hypothetical protein
MTRAKSLTALAREYKGVSPAVQAAEGAKKGGFKTAGQVIRQAGKAGEVEYGVAIKPALKGERSLVGTAKKVAEAIQEGENLRDLRFDQASARLRLKDPAAPINPKSVLGETFDVISKFDKRIKGVPDPATGRITLDFSGSLFQKAPDQAKRIQDLVDVVSDWAGRGDLGIEEAHRVERVIDTLIEKGVNRKAFGESNAVLTRARQAVRKELGAKVEGFDEMQRAYLEASRLLDFARKEFKIKKGEDILEDIGVLTREVPVIDEATLNKLAGVFNDRVVGAQVRQDTLRELDRILATKTGQPGQLFEELAGIHLRRTAPTGISGRVGAAGGVAGLGAGAYFGGFEGGLVGGATGAAAGAIGNLLSNMTIRNPRAVGRFFHALGATERVALGVQHLVERVAKATDAKRIAGGITFGAALKRMEERGKERLRTEKLMRDLGMIQDAEFEEF